MRIIQLLPTLLIGDAIGNYTLALKKVISSMGYKTEIYADSIDPRLKNHEALLVSKIPRLNPDDIIIYHKSTGSKMSFYLGKYKCRKIMIYHNITPPKFFYGYNNTMAEAITYGLKGAKYLSDKIDYCITVSNFNKQNLIDMGYKCKIDVMPILVPFDDYKKAPDKDIIEKYKDGNTNILFVGRVAPNKKHEDVIKSFYYYKKYIDENARLFLVGSYKGMESYYKRLQEYVRRLELEDVYFTGHVTFAQILAYYRVADVFLCLSEHEGFCVPLIEAMYFDVPIIAYNSTAIPDTLGSSGIMIYEKDPKVVAELINKIITDKNLSRQIIEGQRDHIKDFEYEKIKDTFVKYLNSFIGEKQ